MEFLIESGNPCAFECAIYLLAVKAYTYKVKNEIGFNKILISILVVYTCY